MVLIATPTSRELLNSFCTLFPLKLKELEALDPILASSIATEWRLLSRPDDV